MKKRRVGIKYVLPCLVLLIGLSAALEACFGWSESPLLRIVCRVVVFFAFLVLGGMLLGQIRLLKYQEDYLNTMLHELKTPVASIQLLGEMLSDTSITLNEEQRRGYLDLIRQETEREKAMLERLLEGVRMENGREKVRIEQVDINKLVLSLAKRFENRIKAAGCELITKYDITESMLWTDETILENILSNLLENAIKYGSNGSFIGLMAKPKEKFFEVIVWDEGRGIEEKDLKKIFRKFYRVKQSGGQAQPKGYGLGLFYVRNATKALGIEIKAESIIGKGAKFTLLFPNKLVSSRNKQTDI